MWADAYNIFQDRPYGQKDISVKARLSKGLNKDQTGRG